MTPDSFAVSVLFGVGALILIAVLAFAALRKYLDNVASRPVGEHPALAADYSKPTIPPLDDDKSDDDTVKAAIAAEVATATML